MSRARAGRVVSGVAVVAVLGVVTAAGMRLPEPAAGVGADVTSLVPVAAGPTTLVCPGPVVLAADDGAGDAAFDPAPVQTLTTQRVATVAAEGAAAAASSATTTVTPLGGGEPLLRLERWGAVGALDAVAGPTRVRAESGDGSVATVGAATASVTAQGDLRGLAAATCREPSADAWLVGGSTEIGSSALLVVANPGRTPAEVSVRLWGPAGALDAAGAATFLVGPGEQRGVLLEGVAAEQRRIAVHVTAAGGLVSAHLQDSRLNGFTPAGTDLVTAGAPPAVRQVVGGLVVPESSLGEPDTAFVRVLAPGAEPATARLTVLGADGPVSLPGAETVELGPGEVTDVSLAGLPAGTYAVVVDADVPVVAGAMLTRLGEPIELGDVPTLERAWSAAAPVEASGVLPVPPGVNATVLLAAVPAAGGQVLERGAGSDGGAAAGELRLVGVDGATLATYPVEVPAGRTSRLDLAGLDLGADVAAVQLVPAGPGASDAGAEPTATADGVTAAPRLVWSMLVHTGAGTQELVSVLTPAPARGASPDVEVRTGDRLGLP